MAIQTCPSCGAVIPNGAAVCPYCGNRLSNANQQVPPLSGAPNQGGYQAPQGYQQPYQQPPQKNNNTVIIAVAACAIVALVIGAVAFFVISNNNKKNEEEALLRAQQMEMKAREDSINRAKEELDAKARELETKRTRVTSGSGVGRPVGVSPQNATRVVINGRGVRMRMGPGKQYDYPVTYSGHAYTVPKGTSLPFLGKYGNWYKVLFEGHECYVSADYSYLR